MYRLGVSVAHLEDMLVNQGRMDARMRWASAPYTQRDWEIREGD
jgi:hypothetical protein